MKIAPTNILYYIIYHKFENVGWNKTTLRIEKPFWLFFSHNPATNTRDSNSEQKTNIYWQYLCWAQFRANLLLWYFLYIILMYNNYLLYDTILKNLFNLHKMQIIITIAPDQMLMNTTLFLSEFICKFK